MNPLLTFMSGSHARLDKSNTPSSAQPLNQTKLRGDLSDFISKHHILDLQLTPFAPQDSDRFHLRVTRIPDASHKFNEKDLQQVLCSVIQSGMCSTLKVKRVGIDGGAKGKEVGEEHLLQIEVYELNDHNGN